MLDAVLEVSDLESARLGVEFSRELSKDGLALPLPGVEGSLFTVSVLAYCDDVVLLASDTSALTAALGRIKSVGEPLGLNINPGKSKFLWLSGRPCNPGKVSVVQDEL